MSQTRIAHRYAEALLEAAEDGKVLEKVVVDAQHLQSLIAASREFRLFLLSPVIKREKKETIFKELFGASVAPLTLRFLSLLAEKGREDALQNILQELSRLYDERRGIVTVQIKAASELSKQQNEVLIKHFRDYAKKDVRIDVALDRRLIGGFIARFGDTMFDGSVRRQLEVLRQKFVEEGAAV